MTKKSKLPKRMKLISMATYDWLVTAKEAVEDDLENMEKLNLSDYEKGWCRGRQRLLEDLFAGIHDVT